MRIALRNYREYPVEVMLGRAEEFAGLMHKRRTVRDFSSRPVPRAIIEHCLSAAGSAPSGANQQAWHFVLISDPRVKRAIRVAAEAEEKEFYQRRAPAEWLDALALLGTDENKPFLETAPYLIAIFYAAYGLDQQGKKIKHYYPHESVGIASGILITALHYCGLATLTHTPSPMSFLNEILERPAHERPFLLLVTGYPAENATVPDLSRKTLDKFISFR